jgi:DNA repair photolyase
MKKVFGTTEWAKYNANFLSGCQHDCKYCYSKSMAIRFKRHTFETWQHAAVSVNALHSNKIKHRGRTMFPSSHDIHPKNIEEVIFFMTNLLDSGNSLLVVSKPHLSCIERICREFEQYKDKIMFRFTIGSNNDKELSFWEPGAPLYKERVLSLYTAYNAGFETSISCEPMLDTNIHEVVEHLRNLVTDSIWLGKFNNLKSRMKFNGCTSTEDLAAIKHIEDTQTIEFIEKLFDRYKDDPKIKWKESIKKIVGLSIATEKGLDI